MRMSYISILCFLCACGCQRPDTEEARLPPKIPDVTLVSHLSGSLDNDPTLKLGQIVRLVPDKSEPTARSESLVMKLPTEMPFDGLDEQLYLRGFVIGKLSSHNMLFM